MHRLRNHSSVIIRQRKELAELFGFETRNKYEISDEKGNLILYCAEMQKGFWGFLARQFLGHWRSFELHFFDSQKQPVWRANHPFRFIFQRLEILANDGHQIGTAVWKWAFLRKRYALNNEREGKTFAIESGFFSIWRFPVFHQGQEVGAIQKKWGGLLKEVLTDADTFQVEFAGHLSEADRGLILSTAILVDLTYFERKAR